MANSSKAEPLILIKYSDPPHIKAEILYANELLLGMREGSERSALFANRLKLIGQMRSEIRDSKPLDPKGEAGSKKCPLHLIPASAMEEVAYVHQLGSKKYGEYNWRETGVSANIYIAAIMRHLNAYRSGEDLDPESGRSHIAHIGANVNILLDAAACNTLADDRNKKPN